MNIDTYINEYFAYNPNARYVHLNFRNHYTTLDQIRQIAKEYTYYGWSSIIGETYNSAYTELWMFWNKALYQRCKDSAKPFKTCDRYYYYTEVDN